MMFSVAEKLKRAGVLGINKRNADYVLVHNQRRFYPLVDDKVLTKKLAQETGAVVPELYGVIEIQRDVRTLPSLLQGREDFVVKPAEGSQGHGIVVVTGRSAGLYRLADGSHVDDAQLAFHCSNILSGVYSLGGQPDKVMIEYRIRFDPVFETITHQGVPDVRIIVFLGVPVMAMVRLPTRMSKGKANLHQGAIGAGIDIATGRTLTAVWHNEVVSDHPDTDAAVAGVQIPHWDRLLDIAARSYEMTGLGYQGIDLVLDRELGPMILELNARPGLNIQIANREGLDGRLRAVMRNQPATPNRPSSMAVAERVAFARAAFKSRHAL